MACNNSDPVAPPATTEPVLTFEGIAYKWELQQFDDGHATTVLVLLPTEAQLAEKSDSNNATSPDPTTPVADQVPENPACDAIPRLICIAKQLGAEAKGVFKIAFPPALQASNTQLQLPIDLPRARMLSGEMYRSYTRQGLRRGGFVRLAAEKRGRDGRLRALPPRPVAFDRPDTCPPPPASLDMMQSWHRICSTSARGVVETMKYIVDVQVDTPAARRVAGVPPASLVWPLRGNHLDGWAPLAGVHSPFKYEGTPLAPFTWHVEDVGLMSLNHLFLGTKVWFFIPASHRTAAEAVFRAAPLKEAARQRHDQFMRHNSTLDGHAGLRAAGVPVVPVVQRAGEVVVTMPRAYHSGFSATYTVCEAVNYADGPLEPDLDETVFCTTECSRLPITRASFYKLVESVDEESSEDETSDGEEAVGEKENTLMEKTTMEKEKELMENTPTEETPVEETPAEEKPLEEKPLEKTPEEETPVEEIPVEETPMEYSPTEQTPTVDTPMVELSVKKTQETATPVEETPRVHDEFSGNKRNRDDCEDMAEIPQSKRLAVVAGA